MVEYYERLDHTEENGEPHKHLYLEIIKMLLLYGADPDVPNRDGDRALHLAIRWGDDLLITMLIKHGANINLQNQDGYTPIGDAFQYTHLEIVQMLLDVGANVSAAEVVLAVPTRDMNLVEMLLETGADVNQVTENEETALGVAVDCGYVDIVRLLLGYSAHASALELVLAVRQGQHDIIQILLSSGLDVNSTTANEETALGLAVDRECIDIVELLLGYGADVNLAPGALELAVRKGHFNMAKLLIGRGANINSCSDKGEPGSALQTAAKLGRLDIAYLLLENDTQPDDIHKRCQVVAALAEKHGHWVLSKFLRNYDPNRYTPETIDD